MALLRSLLFVPATRPDRIPKALASAADAIIIDLEDSVPVMEKLTARENAAAAIAKLTEQDRCYLRANDLTTPWALKDMAAGVRPGVAGIVLPKVTSARQVQIADWVIGQLEQERELAPGSIELMAFVETAGAFVRLNEIAAASRRLKRLLFGSADFAADLNMIPRHDEAELQQTRLQIAIASKAAGIEPPIDLVWQHIHDAEGLAASAERGHALGYQGKLCIHPSQVEAVNRAFSPREAELADARRIAEEFRKSEAGGAAAVNIDGRMVDYPVALQAEALLARQHEIERKRVRRGA